MMPVYAYKCNTCNRYFEVERKVSEYNPDEHCDMCDSKDTKRVYTLFEVVYNGDGFAGRNMSKGDDSS